MIKVRAYCSCRSEVELLNSYRTPVFRIAVRCWVWMISALAANEPLTPETCFMRGLPKIAEHH